MGRALIIALLLANLIATASLWHGQQRHAVEIRNIKGVVHDQAVTMWNMTHPATVQQESSRESFRQS